MNSFKKVALSTKQLLLNAEQPWKYHKVQLPVKLTLQKIRNFACSSVHVSCCTSVRGLRKCYNFYDMSVFHQICFDSLWSTLRNLQNYRQIWQTLWIGSPSGGQGVRSCSECVKSYSSMKLVNFGLFLKMFLFIQYKSPNS